MSLERNSDLPENLRSGLNPDQQNMVRGLYNALVYEQSMTPMEASQVATKMLQTSGMVYDGKWNVVKSDASAVGVITKVDEEKRLVFGWASIIKDTEGRVLLDRQNDFIDDETELEKSAYLYVLHSRDGGEQHIRKGVSTMVESVVLTKEKQQALGIPEGVVPVGWWIGFRVNDERVWDEVKKGNYSGFSVHGTGQRKQEMLMDGQYTEVEKCDTQKPTMTVSKRYVELLTKAQKQRKNKIATVMREFKAGKLKSSSGKVVTDPKQAMAIAISEQKAVSKHGDHDQSTHGRRGGRGGTGAQRNKRAVNTLADRQEEVLRQKQAEMSRAVKAKMPTNVKVTAESGMSLSSGMPAARITVSSGKRKVSITDQGVAGFSVTSAKSGNQNAASGMFRTLDDAVRGARSLLENN